MEAKFQFVDYKDIYYYLDNNNKTLETKVINLRKCNFGFDLDLDMLFHGLKYKYKDFKCVSFNESIFHFPVELSQMTTYDEKNLENIIDFNIDFNTCRFIDTVSFNGAVFGGELNFINTIFEKEVVFSELIFKGYLRLFGASFYSKVHFHYLELNHRSIFFTKNDNRTKFEGNLYFFNVDFLSAKFWDFDFKKDVSFQNVTFNCPVSFQNAKFLGKTIFSSSEILGSTLFKDKAYFDNAEINDLRLERLVFDKLVSFNYAKIKCISINHVHCIGFPLSLVGADIDVIKDEGTARFLKSEALKSNDPFLIAQLSAKEMTMHYNTLNWRSDFFDKTIFFLNKISTNFGEKWHRGVLFILLAWILSFSLIITLRDGVGKTFIWFDKTYLNEAVVFLWQFGNLDILGKSYGLSEIIFFFIGKILIAYGVYQTIVAFRKYGRR